MQSLTVGAAQKCYGYWRDRKHVMQSLTVDAAQQTVLRLLEGQETCNVELDCWCCIADSVTVIGGTGNM